MSRRVGLSLVLAALWAVRGAAQDESEREHENAPIAEGALDNDVFVSIAPGVLEALAEGDRALAHAHASQASADERARLLDAAFDPWQRALGLGGAGAWSWLDPAPEAERRVCEGVRAGVERRLRALAEGERARWTARLEPQAARAFATRAGLAIPERAARAGEVLRLYPLTAAAAGAALELGDLALESGLGARARAWYARARSDAGLLGLAPTLAALEARRASVAAAPEPAQAWRSARGLACVDAAGFGVPGRRPVLLEGERGVRPGGVFLEDGRFALQSADDVRVFALESTGKLASTTRLRIEDFLFGYTPDPHFEAPREPPGWPLLPAASGDTLVLVLGRTAQEEPNALLALTLEPGRPHADLGLALGRSESTARRAWAVVGDLHFAGAEGQGESVPELAELGDYEFQPGPVVSGERILVQARQYEGQVKAWLLAFERSDGTLAWKQLLAAGADRVANQRFASVQRRVAGQPPLAFELGDAARVFVGTHLGLGVLLDGLTGEPLFGLRNRRRGEREPGWNGDRPPLGAGPDGTPLVLWAPMDSDRLYTLDPRGDGRAWAQAPVPLADAHTLLGGNGGEWLVLGEHGGERTLSARRPGRDPVDALGLGADERFAGLGLVSPERVWTCTDRGVYLFDRTRELYLLGHVELPPVAGAVGGDLYARGAEVLVVGTNAVWSLLAR